MLLRAGPVLRELGRLGAAARERRTRAALAFPGSARRRAAASASDAPACTLPAAHGARRGLRPGRRARRGPLRRLVRPDARRLRGRHGAAGRAAALRARADQVARRLHRRPAEVLEDIDRLQAAGSRSAGCELDNPWEPCNGELTFDPTQIPDPARLIARGARARRPLHALGLAAGDLRRRATPGGTARAAERPGARPAQPRGRARCSRRGCARSSRSAIDGVKADRGDEVDLDGRQPGARPTTTRCSTPARCWARCRAATRRSSGPRPSARRRSLPGHLGRRPARGVRRPAAAIVAAQTAAMSGFPTWGSDVGGYAPAVRRPPELFVRWAQLGAV